MRPSLTTVSLVCLVVTAQAQSGRLVYEQAVKYTEDSTVNVDQSTEAQIEMFRSKGMNLKNAKATEELLRKAFSARRNGYEVKGRVAVQFSDELWLVDAPVPNLSNGQSLRCVEAFDGKLTIEAIREDVGRIYPGDTRGQLSTMLDMVTLGGYFPSDAVANEERTSMGAPVQIYRWRRPGKGPERLELTQPIGQSGLFRHAASFVDNGTSAGHLIAKSEVLEVGKVDDQWVATHVKIWRKDKKGATISEESYRFKNRETPETSILPALTVGQRVYDHRLGPEVDVAYVWDGNLPTESDLRKMQSNRQLPIANALPAGIALVGGSMAVMLGFRLRKFPSA